MDEQAHRSVLAGDVLVNRAGTARLLDVGGIDTIGALAMKVVPSSAVTRRMPVEKIAGLIAMGAGEVHSA